MALGVGHMLLDPGDFGLEQLDPLLKLIDRKRPKVLLHNLGQRVLRPAGKEVILVHTVQR